MLQGLASDSRSPKREPSRWSFLSLCPWLLPSSLSCSGLCCPSSTEVARPHLLISLPWPFFPRKQPIFWGRDNAPNLRRLSPFPGGGGQVTHTLHLDIGIGSDIGSFPRFYSMRVGVGMLSKITGEEAEFFYCSCQAGRIETWGRSRRHPLPSRMKPVTRKVDDRWRES